MTKSFIMTLMITSLTFSQAFSCDISGMGGFAPENNQRIPVIENAVNNIKKISFNNINHKTTNNINEKIFHASIARVSSVYEPIVKKMGGNLLMNNRWVDERVNAIAQQSGQYWIISIFGGIARHRFITVDGLMMIVCHELGHHLGGAPNQSEQGLPWSSNEGQADYFASLKCMRKVLSKDDNVGIVAKMQIDPTASIKCKSVYKSATEVALCQRIAMAGKSLAMFLGDLKGSSSINFKIPDSSVVKKTFNEHPKAQCRLDTYMAGALCDKPMLEDLSTMDAIVGTCIKRDGYMQGVRPLCWYKPGYNEI